MERTRAAALAALSVVLLVAGVAFAAGSDPMPGTLGAVSWPVSTLLVSEVQTGGASASDEFAEITNVGASTVDLAGLELVYVTSTGSTVTRKASWTTSLLLESGRHLFVANTSGSYAGLADATYSGGFAATGGAIAIRVIGGGTVDAVGWGDATNAFVEGSPIAAPAAGSSIERKPGGAGGNTVDTNANSLDWFGQASPNPQSLAAPPVPAPSGSPTPASSSAPSSTPSAAPTSAATPLASGSAAPSTSPTATIVPTPVATATIQPTAEPTAEPTLEPTVAPTPEPTALDTPAPTPAQTPEPTADATPTAETTAAPTPTPDPIVDIAAARASANGSTVTIEGVLTTELGALEAGRKAFIQDTTAGIALYLDTAVVNGLPAGSLVLATGVIDDRFAERTLRVNLVDLLPLGDAALPDPLVESTGSIRETIEGSTVVVTGVTVGSASDLADGLGLMVDDGTGQIRVIVATAALGGASVPSGTNVVATGPVGQRDSSGTGLAGYRIHVTLPGDFEIVVTPTPTPTATTTAAPTSTASATPAPTSTAIPSASPTPTATARPTASAKPSPTPAPTASPGPTPPTVIDIVEARGAQVGTTVTVAGVVTAEAGRLGLPPVLAIADGTGGIPVRLPDGIAAPTRGATVLVRGQLADPYGQLEVRPTAAGYAVTGHSSLPAAVRLTAAQLSEASEGRLAELVGTVTATPKKGTSGDLSIDLVDAAGTSFRVLADASSGVLAADLAKDHVYRLTGIVGQHASRKGALDGYRLYVRDEDDVVPVATSSGPSATGDVHLVPIATALAVPDGTKVTIEATVTAGANLLDSSGRRIVVQDRSGAIEALLPTGATVPALGASVRLTGTTGLAWGAPRIAVTEMTRTGKGTAIAPLTLHRAPAERDEWLLVRLTGTVAKVSRIGEQWRAEMTLADGTGVLVQGQAGAGIASTALVVGRRVTVTGVVRRPYPTASDRRFAVLPRSRADLVLDSSGANGTKSGDGGAGADPTATASASGGDPAITPDTDLARLSEVVGSRVKVGGLIARIADNGFDLDDGTALARVVLRGDMVALLPHLRGGEAVAATGLVGMVDGVPVVIVDGEGSLVRVGALGEGLPIGEAAAPSPSAAGGAPARADSSVGIGGPAPISLLALASLTALSVLATVLRRRLLQRRLRFAVVQRLATLAPHRGRDAGPGPSVDPVPAEHESA